MCVGCVFLSRVCFRLFIAVLSVHGAVSSIYSPHQHPPSHAGNASLVYNESGLRVDERPLQNTWGCLDGVRVGHTATATTIHKTKQNTENGC